MNARVLAPYGVLLLGFVGLAALGCGTSGPAPSASSSSTAAAKPAEAAKPVNGSDFELGTADPKWAGWVAKAPAGAQVMADGVNGARLVEKGPSILDQKKGGDNGFDLAFAWGKEDLKSLKKNLEIGAANSTGDMKLKHVFLKEEPGLLEWTTEVGESKTHNFVMHMNVEKKDITCKNNFMRGAGNEAEHKRHLDACKTLTKKK